MALKFLPRKVFPTVDSIPRTYFLGHHRSGLQNMKSMLSSVDHIIECRDFRIPKTSINPMLEEALGERRRTIVYLKRDLGGDYKLENQNKEKAIAKWDRESRVFFASKLNKNTILPILKYLKNASQQVDPIVGYRIMVVGMPNIGKSTLINALRNSSLKKKKAAATGADPGITRKIGTPIKLFEKKKGPVYLYDTPGVFVPYMPDAESMLKLALCGNVKDSIIPTITLADYLLFHINLHQPNLYQKFSPPTNDIMALLGAVASKSGRLLKGGVLDFDAAARYFIVLWRDQKLANLKSLIMDDIVAETQRRRQEKYENDPQVRSDIEKFRERKAKSKARKEETVDIEDEFISAS